MSDKIRVVIDADYALYRVCPPISANPNELVEEPSQRELRKAFLQEIDDVMGDIRTQFDFELKKRPVIAMSDKNCFRYDIYPEYKANRQAIQYGPGFIKLRDWARKKFTRFKNCEADDVCGWYAKYKKNVLIASMDKDVLYTIPGKKFDIYPSRCYVFETSEYEANRFLLIQTLAGDPTDYIPGIKLVGHKKAEMLLEKFGWNWEGVVKAYKSKGLSEKDAILTRRLVDMQQLNHKKKVRLFSPSTLKVHPVKASGVAK